MNVATPLIALTLAVPESAPPPGFERIESATVAVLVVTTALPASSTLTVKAAIGWPNAVVVGCDVKTSCVAGPNRGNRSREQRDKENRSACDCGETAAQNTVHGTSSLAQPGEEHRPQIETWAPTKERRRLRTEYVEPASTRHYAAS